MVKGLILIFHMLEPKAIFSILFVVLALYCNKAKSAF